MVKQPTSSKQPQQQQSVSLARSIERLLADQLRSPKQVAEFCKLEELNKMYAIQLPYTARSHVELAFEVLDGRKLSVGEPEDESDESRRRLSSRAECQKQQVRSSWSGRLLGRPPIPCCLMSTSDTQQELRLTPSSSAASELTDSVLLGAEPELAELRQEAIQVVGPLWTSLRRSSSGCHQANRLQQTVAASAGGAESAGMVASPSILEQQQQLLMETNSDLASRVSVCLLDKRARWVPASEAAGLARRWTHVESALIELRWKLRQAGRAPRTRDARRVARFIRSRQLQPNLRPSRSMRRPLLFSANKQKRRPAGKLRNEQLNQVVELTKISLNHLIDAQLMLRNKLATEQQLQHQLGSSPATTTGASLGSSQPLANQFLLLPPAGSATSSPGTSRENEYSLLLRNNFNLLKIWQNLEETKRIACFVSEPIKATLADLFHFANQRPQIHQLKPPGCPACSAGDCMLASPLVCLDSIQVKRGMLQILEALNYLHSICKLIHRNLNPRNILVCSNDNWKLGGLQFAIRFESATISESASIMAQEVSSSLLHYSTAAGGSQAALRRQRTLRQTKCDEFVRRPPVRGGLFQPELDYLAPEIWHHAKCSHKSDIFSYGLVLAQTYHLGRHRPPLSCNWHYELYEQELKKLNEIRKRKLAHLVPFEMRSTLLDMLDSEPNLRPSANYALQLFRRPIELCNVNEDSLRHLKSSLGYMDSRWQPSNNNNNNNLGSMCADLASAGQESYSMALKKRASYFKKVTHLAVRSPQRGQTKNLQLFNILLRSVDSLATTGTNGQQQQAGQQQELPPPADNLLLCPTSIVQRQQPFHLLRCQFEQTFESLRQLYRLSKGQGPLMDPSSQQLADSRFVLFLVAFHRRLLDQLLLMRDELPPICRLTAAGNRNPTQNHLLLADLEDKFQSLVSRESLAKLAPVLTDPTLKLEELALDLLAFVGQRCRQSFSQRSRQLLNELTPITGCPSLSSSDEDDDDDDDQSEPSPLSSGCRQLMESQASSSSLKVNLRGQQPQLANMANPNRDRLSSLNSQTINQHLSGSSHRLSNGNIAGSRVPAHPNEIQHDDISRSRQQKQSRTNQLQQATKISITAPSPMGSLREVHQLAQDLHTNEQQNFSAYNHRRSGHLIGDSEHNQMIKRTSELSLRESDRRPAGQQQLNDYQQQQQDLKEQQQLRLLQYEHRGSAGSLSGTGDLEPNHDGDRSRSQLIDDLLRTINDDSFNDIVDYNNKFASQTQQRPKSAIDGCQARRQVDQQQQARPSSLSSSGGSRNLQSQSPQSQQQARPRTLALGQNQQQGTPSKFDNVIRRMSTNLVQNFSKLGGQQQDVHHQSTMDGLRRERSSNATTSTYAAANNLYVDNQVPARRHSDNTINIPSIQVALSSPCATSGSRTNLNQRASQSASKLANKWKLSAKSNSDKLSPNFGSALGYMRRHSSGNTTNTSDQGQSNGPTSSLLFNASPFKTRSSSNLGLDFLLSNRSMKRRCSAASMLGHQTQRKAEDLIDAGMKSVQNMFS